LNKRQRLIEYILMTCFVWGMYLVWLVPFQIFFVGMNYEMFMTWLVWGSIAEMFVAYPIAKAILKYGPKITKFSLTIVRGGEI